MAKITFIGAGSTIFAKNVLGDCMLTESLKDSEIALYDIDAIRLKESSDMIEAMNKKINDGRAKISSYLGVEKRKDAIKNADFIVTAIQVGGYDPCTITDFEIPKKYGLRQTIADTLGIGGIFRTLRTLPVFEDIARDIEEYAPNAWLLNYVNPMAMITGFMLRYTGVKTVGLPFFIIMTGNIHPDDRNKSSGRLQKMTWKPCSRAICSQFRAVLWIHIHQCINLLKRKAPSEILIFESRTEHHRIFSNLKPSN